MKSTLSVLYREEIVQNTDRKIGAINRGLKNVVCLQGFFRGILKLL